MVRTSASLLLVVLCAGLVGSCYGEADLPSCGIAKECPVELPTCVDGLCFHHTIEYLVPLCRGEGTNCCDMSEPALVQQGCLAWSRNAEGDEVSPPTAAAGGHFLYTVRTAGGSLELVQVSAKGELQWSSEVMADASALSAGMLPVPAVSSDGMSAVATDAGVALFYADGKSANESGKLEDPAEEGAVVKGAVTLCAGGSAYVQSSGQTDSLYAIPSGGSGIPFDADDQFPEFGSLPSDLGPVIFKGLGLAVLPVEGGTRLTGAYIKHDVVAEERELIKRWEYPESPLPSAMAGLAADSIPTVYLATRGGVVHVLDPKAEDDLEALRWKSTAPDQGLLPVLSPPMVSKVGTESRVYLAGKDGTIFYVSFMNPDPVIVTKLDNGPTSVALLRGDRGVVAAIPGDGAYKLTFAVSADSIPGLNESPGAYVQRSWTMACSTFGFATPFPNGIFAVACDGQSLGLVAPDYTSPSTAWPTPRGPGNNGCIE